MEQYDRKRQLVPQDEFLSWHKTRFQEEDGQETELPRLTLNPTASHRLTLDLWLAKDNRFLNPKSSYERILTAPPCRLIHDYSWLEVEEEEKIVNYGRESDLIS